MCWNRHQIGGSPTPRRTVPLLGLTVALPKCASSFFQDPVEASSSRMPSLLGFSPLSFHSYVHTPSTLSVPGPMLRAQGRGAEIRGE